MYRFPFKFFNEITIPRIKIIKIKSLEFSDIEILKFTIIDANINRLATMLRFGK